MALRSHGGNSAIAAIDRKPPLDMLVELEQAPVTGHGRFEDTVAVKHRMIEHRDARLGLRNESAADVNDGLMGHHDLDQCSIYYNKVPLKWECVNTNLDECYAGRVLSFQIRSLENL